MNSCQDGQDRRVGQKTEDRRQEVEDRAVEQGNRGPGQQVIVGLWAAGDDD